MGYDFAVFHFSERDGRKWRLEDGVRGSNFADGDSFGECWVRADEHQKVLFKDKSKRNKYTKVIPHEIGHELKRQGKTTLEIHDYDYKNTINKLEQFYIDIGKQQTKGYNPPLLFWEKALVTQPYGESNPVLYTMTGHHIGVDFRAKKGHGVFAPADCEVTRAGYSESLGFWCEVRIDGWYMVALHLKNAPASGRVKRGGLIGQIGDTGMILGVHAHLEAWYAPMDRSKLTKANWNKLTFDITTKIPLK
jgi:murein DD-endopeptidase MepM/ murein hydrolase activator NlpD